MRAASRRRGGRLAAALGVALALAITLPAGPARAADPTVTLDQAEAAVGGRVTVRLAGWPAGNVTAEVCGNQGGRGSIDCAVSGGVTISVGADGVGSAPLPVPRPPGACPCVVRVRPAVGGTPRAAPLAIRGVPVNRTPPAPRVPTALAVVDVRIDRAGSEWPALFAGPARRTVTVTLRNTGQGPVLEPRLSVASGRPGRTTFIVPAPAVGVLAPGQERTVELPVTFGAPTWGRYAVRGELLGADQPAVFHAHTHSYPWGLIAPPVLILGYLLVRAWRRARRPAPVAAPATVR
jgi:hypothetical protein